jgi:nitrite reductase (NO-forming)
MTQEEAMAVQLEDAEATKLREELDHIEEELVQVEADLRGTRSTSWLTLPLALFALVLAVAAVVIGAVVGKSDTTTATTSAPAPAASKPGAASAASAKNVKFEPFKEVDPNLPAVPAGAVKKFRVTVFEHVTKVAPDKAPTRVWSYGVNGRFYRGTGVSAPIVVNQGDKVRLTLVNGGSKAMGVQMPHAIDLHAAEVAPNVDFKTIAPGATYTFSFTAKHPGVFMYHCATQPVLMHTGNGMVGMIVVKPRGLSPAKELWMTQQEYYLGAPGKEGSLAKMQAKTPDVIAFNGYANQYKDHPITVKRGERIRLYVLNAGPSIWSAFHVIGTVFDKTDVEGVIGHDSQTINLAPSQGGYVELTLDKEGTFPFVTHAFGDMVKGALGVLATTHVPKAAAGGGHSMGGQAPATVKAVGGAIATELGEMFVKPAKTQLKPGKVTFVASNTGQLPHMLMVEKTPIKLDAPGQPSESAALGDTGLIQPGQKKTLTVFLKAGTYELFCNVPGHYAAGQKTTITVG